MNLEFLEVISDEFKSQFKQSSSSLVFHQVTFYEHDLDLDLKYYDVAILSVDDNRNSLKQQEYQVDFDAIRKAFYSLHSGGWSANIIDLGHISKGETVEDTYFLIKSITASLIKQDVIPIVVGGSQDIVFPLYRAFDNFQYMINIANVDAKFDLGSAEEDFSNHSFVGKIIVDEPYNLFNYTNLGYLTFLNPQHEIDLMDKLYFEAIRFGELSSSISKVEPSLRDSDLVTLDLTVLNSSTLADSEHEMPNGLTGVDVCSISRYSGMSDRVKCLHLGELQHLKPTPTLHKLLAQVLWYFIEGYSLKKKEDVSVDNPNMLTYNVPIDFKNDEYLVFLYSQLTKRWWIKASDKFLHNNNKHFTLISCSLHDYNNACNNIIPQKWYNAKLKGYF